MGKKRGVRWDVFSVMDLRDAAAELMTTDTASGYEEEGQWLAESLGSAPIIWADKEFSGYSLDASRDVPAVLTFTPPMPRGVLALARPLPAVKPSATLWSDVDEPARVHAVWWALSEGTLWAGALTCDIRFERQPRPALFLIRQVCIGNPGGSEFSSLIMGEDHVGDPLRASLQSLQHLDSTDFAWVRWLATAWELLREPRVTQSRDLDLTTGARPVAGEPVDPSQVIQMKSIRPMEHAGDGSTGVGREFSRRWVVRGHWRNQAVGKGRSDRRVTWIPSHIKGPAGKPLVRPDVVWRWSV